MNALGRLILILCVFTVGVSGQAESAATGDEIVQSMFLSMALDGAPEKSRLGTRSIGQQFATNEALLDVIAELLLQGKRLESNRAWIDAIAWYAVVMRDAHNARYTEALQQARQIYTNERILKQIDAAQANIAIAVDLANSAANPASTKSAQYVAGSVDLAKKRVELQQVLSAHVKSDRAAFTQIGSGSSLQHVIEKLGIPDDMTMMTLPVARWGRTSTLVVHYAGAGFYILKIADSKSHWVVVDPIDEAFPVKDAYRGDQFGTAQILASLRGQPFRLYLKLQSRAITKDESLLSILGTRLIELPYPLDRYEQDGMEIAMKFIAGSKDPSTDELLRKIGATSGKKIPELARAYLRNRELRAARAAALGKAADEEQPELAEADDAAVDESQDAPP